MLTGKVVGGGSVDNDEVDGGCVDNDEVDDGCDVWPNASQVRKLQQNVSGVQICDRCAQLVGLAPNY